MTTKVYTDFDFQDAGRVRGILPPALDNDAATKEYVDNTIAGSAPATLDSIGDVVANPVDKSVLYYDGTTQTFRADSTWTVPTIVDGGNF